MLRFLPLISNSFFCLFVFSSKELSILLGFPQATRDFPKSCRQFLKALLKSCPKKSQKLLFIKKAAQKASKVAPEKPKKQIPSSLFVV